MKTLDINISIITPVFKADDSLFQTYQFIKSWNSATVEWIVISSNYSDLEKMNSSDVFTDDDLVLKYIHEQGKTY
ncbi:MAG: hypothetical protein WDO19_10030 [Bacteroidota bacterium]